MFSDYMKQRAGTHWKLFWRKWRIMENSKVL